MIKQNETVQIRQDHELPESITEWGWKYHHYLGIPTTLKMPNERYIPQFRFYIRIWYQSIWY